MLTIHSLCYFKSTGLWLLRRAGALPSVVLSRLMFECLEEEGPKPFTLDVKPLTLNSRVCFRTSLCCAATSRQRVELDHEKSKKSLAEVYEDEYLRQVKGVGPVQDEVCVCWCMRVRVFAVCARASACCRFPRTRVLDSPRHFVYAQRAPSLMHERSSRSAPFPTKRNHTLTHTD